MIFERIFFIVNVWQDSKIAIAILSIEKDGNHALRATRALTNQKTATTGMMPISVITVISSAAEGSGAWVLIPTFFCAYEELKDAHRNNNIAKTFFIVENCFDD